MRWAVDFDVKAL